MNVIKLATADFICGTCPHCAKESQTTSRFEFESTLYNSPSGAEYTVGSIIDQYPGWVMYVGTCGVCNKDIMAHFDEIKRDEKAFKAWDEAREVNKRDRFFLTNNPMPRSAYRLLKFF